MSKKQIDPTAKTIHLETVADLFSIKPNTLRQYVKRGTMPTPTVRRAPDLGWDAAALYLWAHNKGLIPLNAVPFRHWRYILTHTDLRGPHVPEVRSVSCLTQHSDSGVHVRYGDLTADDLGFTLYYPALRGYAAPTIEAAGIVVQVTGDVSHKGFFVDVRQAHPDYHYDVDSEIHTRDVAELVQTSLPYWTASLRTVGVGIDRRTNRIVIAENATAQPFDQGQGGISTTVEAFAQNHPNHQDLIAALRSQITQSYRLAARDAQRDLDRYVTPVHASQGNLAEKGHLYPAVTPRLLPDETVEEEYARARLSDLVWETPIGDTPTARAVAEQFSLRLAEYEVPPERETSAQAAFRASLVPVPSEEATLVHLALRSSTFNAPPGNRERRTYWADPASGALAVLYRQAPESPERFVYTLPPRADLSVKIDSFDFEDDSQPFIWTTDGAAVPFPNHPDSGYALGYGGTGPHAVKETTARLLGLDPEAGVSARWPFFHRGYPTRISAEEMRGHFTGARR